MSATTEALDVRHYAAHYELLRAQVTGTAREEALGREASPARGIGLALLLREGVPGWLKAVHAVLRASLAAPASGVSASGLRPALEGCVEDGAVPSFAHARQHDITILLASLVLSTRHPPSVSPREGG